MSTTVLGQTELGQLEFKRESLTEVVFDKILEGIIGKVLAPGTRVSEASLATQLGVSKTPVREALLRLKSMGLTEVAPDGLRVTQPSFERIRDAYEYRCGIEQMSAATASGRADSAEHAAITQAAELSLSAASVGDEAGFRSWDREFHRRVAHSAHNPMIREEVEKLLLLTSALRGRDAPARSNSVLCGDEHLRVAVAITAGDGATAAEVMARHIRYVMDMVLESFSFANQPAKSSHE
ncbi:MAG TPA: GntR family transcriptional regulator [Candidatus Paceibacterota bacterium]|nr:GntR family transcriptional regulator [Candidatus Paceibacterota bacterium]